MFTAIYYYSNFHKHFGIWKCAEPKSHFNFALHSAWIVILFAIGEVSRKVYFHMEGHDILEVLLKHSNLTVSQIQRVVTYEVEDQYKFIKSHSLTEDIFWGVVGFYAIDFLR